MLSELTLDRAGCVLHASLLEGPGSPVIVTSGAMSSRGVSLALAEPLVGKRQLLLLELRGHGPSVCRHPEHYTWRNLTEDLLAWVDHLGLTRYALAGTSVGSIASIGATVQRPHQVEALAVSNAVFVGDEVPVTDEHREALEALATAFGATTTPSPARIAQRLEAITPGREQIYLQALGAHVDLDSIATYFRLVGRGPLPYTADALAPLDLPVLVLAGRDRIHPGEVSRQLATALPHARLVETGDLSDVDAALLQQAALVDFFLTTSRLELS